ncbi:MAG: TetR/AcrR family transcriptional regulator [Myxococcales bacterium]|nr:TetR/AcrR family transcriptional regulator [Myxococcales bacterium]MCB9630445.1 TetR/AcrR family transcriptional regulator [Sandaracinaceae bacterium]
MRYKKSAVSSSQIVQAAIRVLARQGYARTSLMDIAREAGMSKGAVHYHFPTKESLIEVVLTTATDAVQQRTIEAWSSGGDPLQSLHNSLEELWKARAERTDEALVVADLLAQSLYDDNLRPHLADYYRLAAEQIYVYLNTELSRMGIKPAIPMEILPRIVIGLLDGLVMQAFVEPDVLEAADVVRAVESLGLALFGVARPPA